MTSTNPISGTVVADALAGVDAVQNGPNGFGQGPARELAALRDLAEAVRALGVGHPELYRPASAPTPPAEISTDSTRSLAVIGRDLARAVREGAETITVDGVTYHRAPF
jgi:hypothetical protein